MDIRMSRLEKMISEKNVTTPATVKAVEEVCVTCGSNHNFNHCPLTRNEFPVFHDNIHQFQQTAAVGNFVQRNPPNLANQMRPPLSSAALAVLTTRHACHPSLASCLSSHGESLLSVLAAYDQSLKALPSQPAASKSESHVPGAVSE
ncbi:hypothetical protein Tco_0878634 [Tanacetum coccineum]|uniref:Uncharacterized protein n=1 Tax=Tanacetum coccineum TaxID=301880 RepID=A0ABQ5C025_9ASTR